MSSRINGGSPQRRTNVQAPVAKPAAKPAAKAKPQAPAAKAAQPKDGFEQKQATQTGSAQKAAPKPVGTPPERITKNFSDTARKDINTLASSSDKVKVTTNKDGSETRAASVTKGNTTQSAEMTTRKGLAREAETKLTRTDKTEVQGGTDQMKSTASSKSDKFGLTTSSEKRERTQTRGDAANGGERSKSKSVTVATDQFGNKTQTQSQTNQLKTGTADDNVTQSRSRSQTTDAFGNKSVTSETKTETQKGKTTVATSVQDSQGTSFATSVNSGKMEDGKYSIGANADWKNRSSTERGFSRETELRESKADKGLSQANPNDKLSKAQQAGDLLGAAGVKHTLAKGEIPADKMKENNRVQGDPNTFVGTRHGYAGKYEASIGADGLKGSAEVEAKAGMYAETKTPDIKEGEAGAQAQAAASLEAKAAASAKGTLNTNGLDASAEAKVGVTASASASAKAQTASVTVAGVPLNASAEATAKVSASLQAEASVKTQVTRNPPTAIIEGSAGASAVAKAEVEAQVSAGPFTVKGNAYASAGAEATIKGSIGYEDGKLKISGSMGAALGLGAGAGAAVEVDVAQIGEMAKNTATAAGQAVYNAADVDNDGKLGLGDAQAAVNNAANTVKGWFGW